MRWSPMSRVSSMELEGILKACTRNVVPNSANTTVTTSDSRYSRAVDFWTTGSAAIFWAICSCESGAALVSVLASVLASNAILLDPAQRDLRGGLLRGLLAAAFAERHLFSGDPQLD